MSASRPPRRWVVPAGVAALTLAGCASNPSGALVIAVETDVPLPKDVDTIELQVQANGSTQFDNTYPVGMGALLVPATLTLLPGSTAGEPVTIRLLAYQSGMVRMLRQAVTTVPTARVATLLMPIQWLDFGMTTGGSMTDPTGVQSSCTGSDMTSDEGACVSDKVDSTTLPAYSASAVFGGGDGTGDGTCFDLLGCFAGATKVSMPTSGPCDVTSPSSGIVNVALVTTTSNGDGECNGTECIVPLPMGASGWTQGSGQDIHLPAAACGNPNVAGVLVSTTKTATSASTTCASYATNTPLCGPWSSVATDTPLGGRIHAPDAAGDGTVPPKDARGDTTVPPKDAGSDGKDAGSPPKDASGDTGNDATVDCGGVACSGTCEPGGGCLVLLGSAPVIPVAGLATLDGYVYWLSATAGLYRVSTSGGDASALTSDAGTLSASNALVLDGVNAYWTQGNGFTPGAVLKMPLTGGPVVTLAPNQSWPGLIAVNSTSVFWVNNGAIMKVPTGGGSAVAIATGQSPEFLVADDTSVYWTDYAAGEVRKISVKAIDGGPSVVASNQGNPTGIAIDPAHIYWVSGGINPDFVARAALDGGGRTTLTSDAGSAYGLAVDPSNLYVTNDDAYPLGSVVRIPLDGGPTTAVGSSLHTPQPIILDDASVYWTETENNATQLMKLTPK